MERRGIVSQRTELWNLYTAATLTHRSICPLSFPEARPQPVTFKVCYLSILERVVHGIGLNSVHSDCFVTKRVIPG